MNNQLIVFSSPLHQWRYSQSPSCLCTEVPVKQPFGFPTFPESSTTLHAQRKEYQSFAIGPVLLFPRWPILHLQYPAISSSTYTSRYVLPSLANFPNANFVLLQSRKLMPSGTQISSKLIKDLVGDPRKDWDRHHRQLRTQRFSCRRNHIEFIIIQSLTKSLASICHCSLTFQRSQNTGSGCIAWPWVPTVPLLLKKIKQSLLIFIRPSRLGHGYKPNRVR